jgi:WD40 repeat protein
VAASPDGKWIASGGADKKLIVWSQALNRLREMTEAAGDVFAVAISPDSRLVAAGSMDGKTRVYTLADGKLVWELPARPRRREWSGRSGALRDDGSRPAHPPAPSPRGGGA